MKKRILTSLVSAVLLSLPLSIVTAVTAAPTISVMGALDDIINWLFAILLVVAAIFIIVAAYYFITAQGDPEKTKTARNFVLYALIGVLVGFLAKGLVALVGKVLGQ